MNLADFAQGNMNDYDDDGSFGDGYMDFAGATFDVLVQDGQPFRVRTTGYDQDCLDDWFGDHGFHETTWLDV